MSSRYHVEASERMETNHRFKMDRITQKERIKEVERLTDQIMIENNWKADKYRNAYAEACYRINHTYMDEYKVENDLAYTFRKRNNQEEYDKWRKDFEYRNRLYDENDSKTKKVAKTAVGVTRAILGIAAGVLFDKKGEPGEDYKTRRTPIDKLRDWSDKTGVWLTQKMYDDAHKSDEETKVLRFVMGEK